ncbi:RrF2 family transcriptional regulator [Spirochaeta lutea]|uniref:AsnC family transcriptional regulator n=1 Tax=Spirochaeta lutea TaxID=1480694 RepID=A0A098QWC2_9SPIO|nr:Rrf2 family transcriptional regulator [Spirochaeta lutea]KGE71708.1 AsnC family transcriptional regulator [Spirochaeta lutea]
MRITTKGRYALRAMTNLALSDTTKPKAIKSIAAEEEISPEFLEQIFFKLKKAGVISSVRGPGGGFILHQQPREITVRAIFEAVDEGLDLTPCTSCSDDAIPCTKMDTCLVHNVWKEASEKINSFFDSITLQKIMDDAQNSEVNNLLSGEDVKIG